MFLISKKANAISPAALELAESNLRDRNWYFEAEDGQIKTTVESLIIVK